MNKNIFIIGKKNRNTSKVVIDGSDKIATHARPRENAGDGGNHHLKSGMLFYQEWMIVLLIVGILTALAAPHFTEARRGAVAARIVCDFNTIFKASAASFAETEEFPATAEWGEMPPELANFLPSNFEFHYKNISYRWRRWSLPSGLPERPNQDILVGLQVRARDSRMVNSIVKVYRGRITQLMERQVTFVIL